MSDKVKLQKAIRVKNADRRFGSALEYVILAIDQSDLPKEMQGADDDGKKREFVALVLTPKEFRDVISRGFDNPEDVRTYIKEVVNAELDNVTADHEHKFDQFEFVMKATCECGEAAEFVNIEGPIRQNYTALRMIIPRGSLQRDVDTMVYDASVLTDREEST